MNIKRMEYDMYLKEGKMKAAFEIMNDKLVTKMEFDGEILLEVLSPQLEGTVFSIVSRHRIGEDDEIKIITHGYTPDGLSSVKSDSFSIGSNNIVYRDNNGYDIYSIPEEHLFPVVSDYICTYDYGIHKYSQLVYTGIDQEYTSGFVLVYDGHEIYYSEHDFDNLEDVFDIYMDTKGNTCMEAKYTPGGEDTLTFLFKLVFNGDDKSLCYRMNGEYDWRNTNFTFDELINKSSFIEITVGDVETFYKEYYDLYDQLKDINIVVLGADKYVSKIITKDEELVHHRDNNGRLSKITNTYGDVIENNEYLFTASGKITRKHINEYYTKTYNTNDIIVRCEYNKDKTLIYELVSYESTDI